MATHRIRSLILILGDLAVFYLALAFVLLIRYGTAGFEQNWALHQFPFSIVFLLWIVIFFVAGLYEIEVMIGSSGMRERLTRTMVVAGTAAVILFYAVPAFGIAPKTNLVIHVVLSTLLLLLWRALHGIILVRSKKIKILFFGSSPEVEKLIEYLQSQPQLNYEPTSMVVPAQSGQQNSSLVPIYPFNHNLPDKILHQKINLVVAVRDIRHQKDLVKMLYDILPLGVAFIDFPTFYGRITGKVPVSLISEVWFLENLAETEKRVFEITKRGFDILTSVFLGLAALILFPFIAFLIRLGSRGPVFFKQARVGKNSTTFKLVKFRSMIENAERGQAVWAEENDERVTRVGKFLRKTRLDELPQLWNVFKGDMSLIGPRPERPEFIDELKEKIPHYMMRLLVRPGLSGWAQIKFPYGASVKDALEKLQYDLYYVKHRSLALDVSIALKTIATLVSRRGR